MVYILYVIQIYLASYIFILKGELAIYTNLFIVFYGIFGIIVGVLYFKESITTIQTIGICFGLCGTILMNL
jgi:drug/metabolite transporter (DMT)-like permease